MQVPRQEAILYRPIGNQPHTALPKPTLALWDPGMLIPDPARPPESPLSSLAGVHTLGQAFFSFRKLSHPSCSQDLLFFFLFFLLAMPRGVWDLSSPTRDRTHAPCSGSTAGKWKS